MRSSRRAGATCSCTASANRSRRSRQPAPTSDRRRVSADGRWIAYVSDASGRDEVYVARLDRAGEAMQMTKGGATEPVWAREGLFYREGREPCAARARGRQPWRAAGDFRRTLRARSWREPRVLRRRSAGPVFRHAEERAAAARVAGREKLGNGVAAVLSSVRWRLPVSSVPVSRRYVPTCLSSSTCRARGGPVAAR